MKSIVILRSRERKWREYHKFERRHKKAWLRKVSEKECFAIFGAFYQLCNDIAGAPEFDASSMDKVRALAGVHSIYGTVK